ncbi:poxvirus early transcription factor [Faustovirus]|nr:poxvirus early transcription factor [Faustovirus]
MNSAVYLKFDVEVDGKKLTLQLLTTDIRNYIWKYEIAVKNTSRAHPNRRSVISGALKDASLTLTVPIDPIDGFIKGDEIMIKTGQFTLMFTVCELNDIIQFTYPELFSKWLPAIVRAYVDARYLQGVNYTEIAQLNDLIATIAPDNTVDKMTAALNDKNNKSNEDAKYNKGFVYQNNSFVIYALHTRHHRLEKVWQFARVRNGISDYQTTIDWANGKVDIYSVQKREIEINFGDLLKIEVGLHVMMIYCRNNFTASSAAKWIRECLLELVSGICHHTIGLDHPDFATTQLQKMIDYAVNAKATYDAHIKSKPNNTLPIQAPKAEDSVKYLSGFARKCNALGIETTRFGTMVKKCIVELCVPDQTSIKLWDATKFAMVRIKRMLSDAKNKGSFQAVPCEALFNINGEKLKMMINGFVSEYYITYDGKYIATYPIAIDFENK